MDKKEIILDGKSLTIEEIREVAENEATVTISTKSRERIRAARALIFRMDQRGEAVYGLNMGVGWNKDRQVKECFYPEYNANLLRSHMIGVNPECTMQEVRGSMVIRLNKMACGHTGVAEEIPAYLEALLNLGITPVLKKRGSIGEADIGTLSGIGLAMIGEGEVFYQGERLPAMEALLMAGLKPLQLGPKDGLGIVSSNAQSAAFASLCVSEMQYLLDTLDLIFCLSLEAFHGVVHPLDESVNAVRGFRGQLQSVSNCNMNLKGSYLFGSGEGKALQDPLSFRSHCAVMGAVRDALHFLKQQLLLELNSSDDNPCLLPEQDRAAGSSNFEPLAWVLPMEMLGIGLMHLSRMMVNRMLRLADPAFTKLSRFLSPKEENVIAFSTLQKTFTALDTENRLLAAPSSFDYTAVAGQIEDHASNAGFAVLKIERMLDNLTYMAGIELLHGAQAIDLRKPDTMGEKTKPLFENYRKEIPFLKKDRNLSVDIQRSYDFIKKIRKNRWN